MTQTTSNNFGPADRNRIAPRPEQLDAVDKTALQQLTDSKPTVSSRLPPSAG